MPDSEATFLTAEQAARVLNCSAKYMLQMLRSRQIKGRLVARKWITTREALNEYVMTPPSAQSGVNLRSLHAQSKKPVAGVDLRRKRATV